MRRLFAAALASAIVLTAFSCDSPPEHEDGTHEALDGSRIQPDVDDTDCFALTQPDSDDVVIYFPVGGQAEDCYPTPPVTDPPVTDPPPATDPPVTDPPVTDPPVTDPPATDPPATDPPTPPNGFVETFNGNTGLDRFDRGVWHRDDIVVATTSWTGDHDENCGTPASQRPIDRANPDDSFYVCRDHMMTAVGDTSGYSIGWFSPKQTFTDETKISFDVNSTDMGIRQWWEVALVPADYQARDVSLCDDAAYRCQNPRVFCPQCTAGHSATTNTLDVLAPGGIQFGTNGGAGKPQINYSDVDNDFVCRHRPMDPEGCASKPIRRTWSFEDNQDGTVTLSFDNGTEVREWTEPGEFPPGEWKVIFKDHNYTPLKVSPFPVEGFTWHWDNISIT